MRFTRPRRAALRLTVQLLLACPLVAGAQDLSHRIERYLNERAGPGFSGVLLVARDDSVLFQGAYGMADADLGIRITAAHRFGIGSLTKPITATAVMRFVDRAVIGLDDPACRFLARCPDSWRAVTVRHLLSHTSGIPDLFGELPSAPADSLRAVVDAAVLRHVRDTLRAPPGSRYAYSNFNYILLGYVLAVVGQRPWEEVLRTEVFQPAGMRDTQYDDVWAILPGRVRGYEWADGRIRNVNYHDHAAYTAGGLLSTVQDLLRYDRAFSSGILVADSLVRLMMTPVQGNYGLGWQVIRVFGRTMRNHSGGVTGFASHLAHYDDGTTIILLSNVENEPAKSTACDVAALVFGLEPSSAESGQSACRPDA